jgi:soluble epoxide hydrolase/lipid-phosphate phosphatase
MDTSKLVPNDPRVKYVKTTLNGRSYRYILGEPQGTPIDTIFLIHGFPDMAFGWRAQIPYLMSIGFRVVAPDNLGFAGSEAPADKAAFSLKTLSGDIKELAKQVVGENKQIIVGAHDWGSALAYRVALWHPELVKALFSVCVPYPLPSPQYVPLEILVEKFLPNFKYQLQFIGPDVQERIQGEEKLRQFLNAVWGGTTDEGEFGISSSEGINFDVLPKLNRTKLLSEEELDHYAKEYASQQAPELRGSLNWYRMRKETFEEERELVERGVGILELPVLYIGATKDVYLPPKMSASMDETCKNLTRGEVDATHWAMVQKPTEVNQIITDWLRSKVLSQEAKASL